MLKHPGRVLARARELRKELLEGGFAEEALAARGFGKRSATLHAGVAGRRSPNFSGEEQGNRKSHHCSPNLRPACLLLGFLPW